MRDIVKTILKILPLVIIGMVVKSNLSEARRYLRMRRM